jgi:predicted nucleic acid-binding protein
MRPYLLDTGIAGDFVTRRRGVYELARDEVGRGNRIGIGIPVLAELAYGIEHSTSCERNMQRLRGALAALKAWPFDHSLGLCDLCPHAVSACWQCGCRSLRELFVKVIQ